jgi:3-keto-5-aminohexanoate cleavage enzyme
VKHHDRPRNASRRAFVRSAAVGLSGLGITARPGVETADAAAQGATPPAGQADPREKLVITLSPSGQSTLLPRSSQTQDSDVNTHAAAALDGINAGAAIVHLRGASRNVAQGPGMVLNEPDLTNWQQLTEAVRSKSNVIINYGASAMTPPVRKTLLTLKPEAGSFLVGHHYGGLPVPSEAQRQYAIDYLSAGVLPEVEVFHTGDVANLLALVETGLLRAPYCVTVFLNYSRYYQVPPTPLQLEAMVAMLPPRTHWTVCVRGSKHLDIAALAIAKGGHVRTGLENDVELSPGRPARTQAECVERILQLARSMGREIASPDDARQLLAVPRKPEVVPPAH